MAEVTLQTHMKSNIAELNSDGLLPVRQSTEAYFLNVEGNITSLNMALFQDVYKYWRISEAFDTRLRDVLKSDEASFSQSVPGLDEFIMRRA